MKEKDENGNEGDLSEKRRPKLAAGVLKQSARDLRGFNGVTSKAGRELYLDAHRWLTANEFAWPYSFLNVCNALHLAPETVRAKLISDLSLGTSTYWRRRIPSAIAL